MPNPSRDTTAGRVFNDLRNLARRTRRNTDELLLAYVLERFLYRISLVAPEQFILKGGFLLALFDARRPTRDIDMLAYAVPNDHASIRESIARFVSVDVDDGVTFDVTSISMTTIREGADYLGVRVSVPTAVGRARIKLSLDVNFGDPVTPGPQRIDLPQLLDLGTFTMLGYPIETVIAEKLTTAVALGDANTRDRDYADLYRLVTNNDLSGSILAQAIAETADYRGIAVRPLSDILTNLGDLRQGAYAAWRRRQGADQADYPEKFMDVLALVVRFADPLLGEDVRSMRWECQEYRWASARQQQFCVPAISEINTPGKSQPGY